LYKQVVEQLQASEKVKEYAKTYSSMKPKEAAAIFDTMTNDYDLVAEILNNMDAQSRADILGKMNSKNAAALTEIMEPKSK
jgi:flagellar motility protein MotE (MotC chaperone)